MRDDANVNPKLVASELKKLVTIGIISVTNERGNKVYSIDTASILFKPLKSIFIQKEWFEWERPARIHHLVLTLEAGLKPMKEYYGESLPYSHLVFNYDNVTWFFKMDEFLDVGEKLIDVYKERKKEIWDDFKKYAELIGKHDNYDDFYENYVNFWKVAYITEPVSFFIDSKLQPGEQITIGDRSFTEEYETQLWELAKQAKEKGIDKVDLSPTVDAFHWIRNSYHGIHRLTKEDVITEIKKRIGKKKLKPQKISLPKSLSKDLVEIGEDMILMQDMRKKHMMQAAYHLHEFLKSIGNKHDISTTDMMQTLPSEVVSMKSDVTNLKASLKKRQKSATIVGSVDKGIVVYDGEMIFPEGIDRRSKFEVRGRVACGGKAVGSARVLDRAEEIYKVNHGDVIVAPMTSPDFIPAIRRCVAIVTNFGGITCHAAIVAREFNIPCIVGTDNATERLTDGDLVEVDADNGVVRVLRTAD